MTGTFLSDTHYISDNTHCQFYFYQKGVATIKNKSESSNEMFELEDKIRKINFLSSDIMNSFFEQKIDTLAQREYILYILPRTKIMFEMLYEYIVNLKNQINMIASDEKND